MSTISGSSLLAVQAYASQTAPIRSVNVEPPRARVEARPAFSVELSREAANALRTQKEAAPSRETAASSPAQPAEEANFQLFSSAQDMGARKAEAQDFAREAPLRSSEAPVRNVRPGTHLDIKI